MLAIVNDAAVAYRGVIPADRWHEPYMPEAELRQEIAAGVEFWGLETDDGLIGIMGVQPVRDVELIRHAYVRPDRQRHGVGAELIEHLRRRSHTAHARRHVGRCDAGRSASINVTGSSSSLRRAPRRCSAATGRSRSGRSTRRWCWRIRR